MTSSDCCKFKKTVGLIELNSVHVGSYPPEWGLYENKSLILLSESGKEGFPARHLFIIFKI